MSIKDMWNKFVNAANNFERRLINTVVEPKPVVIPEPAVPVKVTKSKTTTKRKSAKPKKRK